MLRDGLYTRWPKPNYALGFMTKPIWRSATSASPKGYTYANVDSVDVTVHGIGGHGAYPHRTKDPIVLAAEMINQWQTIASRENNPLDPIVITVGSIHGGTKHNIIPDEVKMQLTVRTYKQDVRERVLAAIERIAKGCATAAAAPPDQNADRDREKDQFTPATYNNPELTKRLVAVWKKRSAMKTSKWSIPTMGGEDFSEYSCCRIIRFRRWIFMSARSIRRKSRNQEAGGTFAAAEFAFEQVRARAGANDSHWNGGDDRGGAGSDEEIAVGNPSFSVIPSASRGIPP
jgi:amidohydrolase